MADSAAESRKPKMAGDEEAGGFTVSVDGSASKIDDERIAANRSFMECRRES